MNVYNISTSLCVAYTPTISLHSHKNRTIHLCEFHAYVQDINSEFLFLFSALLLLLLLLPVRSSCLSFSLS